MALLEVDDLSVDFGATRALSGLSFSLEPGERLGVIGVGGAGKTLVALALAGLLPRGAVRTGTLQFEGKPLTDAEASRSVIRAGRLGVLLQDAELDPLRHVGTSPLLARFGLAETRRRLLPEALTAEERQSALLGQSLVRGPGLLVADDPGMGLDPIARRRLLERLSAYADEHLLTLILMTREPRLAALLSTRVVVLREGRISDSGKVEIVLRRPRDEYVRMLIAAGKPRARALMRSPVGTELLSVHGLKRAFPTPGRFGLRSQSTPALRGVSFTLKAAEAVGVVGPAGSGKTILARSIAGLDRADSGQIVFDRHSYRGHGLPRKVRPELTLVAGPPRLSFDPRLTAAEVAAEPLRLLSKLLPPDMPEQVLATFELVGLSRQALARRAVELSPPQALRLALARALVTRPRLLLVDAPFEALDPLTRDDMLALVGRLRADLGLTLLFFARDLELVRGLVDRVLILDDGRIVDGGRPAELYQVQRHPMTEALVNARLPDL